MKVLGLKVQGSGLFNHGIPAMFLAVSLPEVFMKERF